MSDPVWTSDILPGYEARRIDLPRAQPAPGEPDGPVHATLVRRQDGLDTDRAVLYVHGWNDYFFQTHVGDFFADLGFAFYAVDLRRYGRSRQPDQLGGYISDLDLYTEELDAALDLIHERHSRVTLMAHSTGGLVGVLWADQRKGELDGVILNSPWLDLQGSQMLRTLGSPLIAGLGTRMPVTVLPLPDSGLNARAMHVSLDGEWDYDLALKQNPGPPLRVGWLAAILAGHQRVASGLSLDCPVLVMCSTRSDFRRRWHEDLKAVDVVLDVEQIAQRAVRLGRHVTVVRVEGGMHDLVLSAPPVREHVFDELRRWVLAYVTDRDTV